MERIYLRHAYYSQQQCQKLKKNIRENEKRKTTGHYRINADILKTRGKLESASCSVSRKCDFATTLTLHVYREQFNLKTSIYE